jgi:hypothetical protein
VAAMGVKAHMGPYFTLISGWLIVMLSMLCWVVTLCGFVGRYQRFGETYYPSSGLKIETVCSTLTVAIYKVNSGVTAEMNIDSFTAVRISNPLLMLFNDIISVTHTYGCEAEKHGTVKVKEIKRKRESDKDKL